MAAEITLFAARGTPANALAHIALDPIASYTATIASLPQGGSLRIYANAAAVILTIDGITFTVPSGTVEYFGVRKGTAVTVA